jgi:hypothetical protein
MEFMAFIVLRITLNTISKHNYTIGKPNDEE